MAATEPPTPTFSPSRAQPGGPSAATSGSAATTTNGRYQRRAITSPRHGALHRRATALFHRRATALFIAAAAYHRGMLLAADGLLGFLVLVFWVYCLFDVITAESTL